MTTGRVRTRKLAPSVSDREELSKLLLDGVGSDDDLLSALGATVTRFVVQRLLEAEQADFLGQRGRYRRRQSVQRGSRNGYEPGWLRTANGPIKIRIPQVRNTAEPYRSGLLACLRGDIKVIDRVILRTYAAALSSREVDKELRDASGAALISGAALAEAAYEVSEDYQVFNSRDLSYISVRHLYCDVVFESETTPENEEAVLIAWSTDSDGRQKPLHLAVDDKDSEDIWISVFWNLIDRHMWPPATVICNGSRAVTKAAEIVFPNAVLMRTWIQQRTERWTGTA